jgi:deoxyhypusine synthase
MSTEPDLAKDAVLQESEPMPKDTPVVAGWDFNQGVNYDGILKSFKYSGFQATNFGKAVDEINKMIECRSIPLDEEHQDEYEDDEFIKRKQNCTIFFGYTSNMVSSGLRETIRFLVQHKLIDCIVTTAGE